MHCLRYFTALNPYNIFIYFVSIFYVLNTGSVLYVQFLIFLFFNRTLVFTHFHFILKRLRTIKLVLGGA